ncbi:MAG: ribosomal-protein-alanine N-acetyltransferase, partial [Gemmatimonadales bacterium]
MAVPFQIRPATPADVPALLALERLCFPDPWSERGITESLEPPNGGGLVAESGRGIIGYLITREVGGSGEILNLAIA